MEVLAGSERMGVIGIDQWQCSSGSLRISRNPENQNDTASNSVRMGHGT